ncbi:MAG TPA: TonB-dependent siderophore receptor, partial [Sphingobium sp.]|nr:TonB-dependent siderophore receptor [Sphingobium sp.]
TTFRAGIIGEIGAGFSPFFSYTESFLPVAGRIDNGDGTFGDPYRPQTGSQYEAGIKWQPAPGTLVTATAFKIKERNRVLYLAAGGTAQSGELNTKGFEVEASHTLPGDFELLANYGYTKLKSETNTNLDYMPRHTASFWTTKTFGLPDEAQLRLGGGVVHSGKSVSTSAIWSIVTPSR